ncbi:MAG TPA: CsgG/HfaB family protein [Spirochaetota bacterium]|nr:CsgG/HfaB family protein [Spirochaetota bacterium]
MKKSILVLSFLTGILYTVTNQTAIAFTGFTAKSLNPSAADILSELVRSELLKAANYKLVDRSQTSEVLKEQQLQQSGLADSKTLARLGQLLGANKLAYGALGQLGELYIINLKIIDVPSGQVEKEVTEEFVGKKEDLRLPVKKAAQKLIGFKGLDLKKDTCINFISKPAGIGVYINGLFEGHTPLKVNISRKPNLKERENFNIKFYSPGYQPWKQSITVERGQTAFVKAAMLESSGKENEKKDKIQDGRPALVTFMTLYTPMIMEFSLAAFNAKEPRQYIGLALLSAPAGFFTSFLATKNTPVSAGRNGMIISSSAWGVLWGLSTAGIIRYNSTAGIDTADPDYYDKINKIENNTRRTSLGLAAAGGTITTAFSILFTRNRTITARRIFFINLGTFMGTLIGLGVPILFNINDHRITFATMLGGSISGGAITIGLTRNMDAQIMEDSIDPESSSLFIIDKKKNGLAFTTGRPQSSILNTLALSLLPDHTRFDLKSKVSLLTVKY